MELLQSLTILALALGLIFNALSVRYLRKAVEAQTLALALIAATTKTEP